MNNKSRVLYFVDCLEYGGIQKYIKEIVDNINGYQIDILTINDNNVYPLENIFKNHGVNVYKINSIWNKKGLNYVKHYREAERFFKKHNQYDIFHLHGTSKNYYLLKLAKNNNIKIRITHSHSTDFASKNIIKRMIGKILKSKLIKYSTNLVACSNNAGNWLFNGHKFNVLNNGIDTEKYIFNDQERNNLRKKYNLEDKMVIGTVGRLTPQKNILFLVDVLRELLQYNNNFFWVLIGSGELENKLRKKITKYGLNNNFLLLKNIDDIYNYYNLFDIYVSPSLREGFNISLIEAQINNLYCLVNENVIPNEAIVSQNVIFSKNNSIENYIVEIKKHLHRNNSLNKLYLNYDIKKTTKELEKYYGSIKQ